MQKLNLKTSRLIEFSAVRQERGNLFFGETEKHIPFDIKRFYLITHTPKGIRRGGHAHHKTEQILLCVSGEVTIHLDSGKDKESIVLSDPGTGIYLGPMLWHEMSDFKSGTVLAVLASMHYDEKDYIRNYEDFIQRFQKKVRGK